MKKQKTVTIVAFGDSITACHTEMPDEAQRWPSALESALRARFPARMIRVVNAGAGGNTSREGLARMETDVLAHRPDYVLVEFGGNDATPEPGRHVPIEEFHANLAAMKNRLEARGGGRMIILPFPPILDRLHAWRDEMKSAGGQDRYVEQYRQAARTFAAGNGLPLADIDLAIRENLAESIMADGVHLTPAGNRRVMETVLAVLTDELRREEKRIG